MCTNILTQILLSAFKILLMIFQSFHESKSKLKPFRKSNFNIPLCLLWAAMTWWHVYFFLETNACHCDGPQNAKYDSIQSSTGPSDQQVGAAASWQGWPGLRWSSYPSSPSPCPSPLLSASMDRICVLHANIYVNLRCIRMSLR